MHRMHSSYITGICMLSIRHIIENTIAHVMYTWNIHINMWNININTNVIYTSDIHITHIIHL